MGHSAHLLTLLATGMLIAGCTTGTTDALSTRTKVSTPQSVMVHIAKRMQACWFKRNLPATAPYRLASEVNSYSGKPRVLLVPKNKPGGLPKLVVQAERTGGIVNVSTFGPLLETKDGLSLEKSVRRWARGSSACA